MNARSVSSVEQSGAPTSPFLPMKPQHRFFVVACFGLFLAVVAMSSLWSTVNVSQWLPLALSFYMAVLLVPLIGYKRSYGWLHPLVFSSIMAFIQLVREYAKYVGGIEWHVALPGYNSMDLSNLIAYELVLQSIGVLAYYAGYFFLPTLRAPRLSFRQPRHLNARMPMVIAISTVIFLVYLQQQGGLSAHLLSWGKSRHTSLAGEFYFSLFISVAAYVCILWLALEPRTLRQPMFWLCAAVSLGMIFLASGSRGDVVYVVLVAIMIDMLRRQKIPATKLILFGLATMVVISVLGEFRRGTREQDGTGNVNTSAFSGSLSLGERIIQGTGEVTGRGTTGDATLPILERVPDEIDLLYGESYLALLTLPIPRGMWTWGEKPPLIGGRVGRTFFGKQGGVPPGAVGEAYWNFHIPGVLVAFLLFGGFHRWLAKVLTTYRNQAVIAFLYVVTLWFVKPITTAISAWLYIIVPMIVLMSILGVVTTGRRRSFADKLATVGTAD